MAHVTTRKARSKVQGVTIPRVPGHLTALAERTCDSMRFTAALRRFIAPSKHKMPAGSVHAWVHPHFALSIDIDWQFLTLQRQNRSITYS